MAGSEAQVADDFWRLMIITDILVNQSMRKAISEQILLYYNKVLYDKGLITDKEYRQMNVRISAYIKKAVCE